MRVRRTAEPVPASQPTGVQPTAGATHRFWHEAAGAPPVLGHQHSTLQAHKRHQCCAEGQVGLHPQQVAGAAINVERQGQSRQAGAQHKLWSQRLAAVCAQAQHYLRQPEGEENKHEEGHVPAAAATDKGWGAAGLRGGRGLQALPATVATQPLAPTQTHVNHLPPAERQPHLRCACCTGCARAAPSHLTSAAGR